MKTIGIIGGGQLGMMLAQAIHTLGAKAIALDPNPKCSASYVCDDVVVSEYDNLDGLRKLGKMCDVLTYEFENVDALNLRYINENFNLPQDIKPLFDSQNRIREKDNARRNGLKTPKYFQILSLVDLLKGISQLGYPCVYKTTTLGYDGHGQVVLKSKEDIVKVEPFLKSEGVLEEFIKYDYETSVIMVRSKEKLITFPMSTNIHKEGILDLCIANEETLIEKEIKESAKRFMINANYYGILTIEFFVRGNEYFFNEMAPRPHNSGHYTIEGCTTSQYLELAKYLLDIPLEEPKLISPTIMKNILGFDYENMKNLNSNANIHIHDYNKLEVRPKRKMGHITFTNLLYQEFQEKYQKLFCEEKRK